MTAEVLPSETSRYIVEELETVVNSEYLRLLKDSPHTFSVKGYRPLLRYVVPDIIGLELDNAGLCPDELEGVDVNFTFPANDPYGSIKDYVINWHNGVHWTYGESDQLGPFAYAGHHDQPMVYPSYYRTDDIPDLVNAAGLPFKEMASNDPNDLEGLLSIFGQGSRWMHHIREKKLPLDPFSSLRIVQDSQLMQNEETAEKQLIQELRLEVRHFDEVEDPHPAAMLFKIATAHPKRAQHIVFHRDQTASRWEYYASYDGPIRLSETPGEYIESIDRLIAPPTLVAIQINEALESMPS